MRRVRYYEYGGPEVLRVEEADLPEPGPGEVLIRAGAIGANFVDTKIRTGPAAGAIYQRPLPGRLTGDVVGTVEAVGPGTDPALVGRRVAALVAEDAYADHVVTEAAWLAEVPAGLDDAGASILPTAAPVALATLRAGRLAPGETVLVHAAAGVIGHLAVQFAKLLGAGTVVAAVGSPDKFDFVRAYGADAAVDHRADDWPDQVRKAAPRGVDVVLDSVGGETLRQSVDLLAPQGRAVVYGFAGGDFTGVPPLSLVALKSLTGFSLLAKRAAAPEAARQDITEATEHALAGRLRTAVHAQLPLTDAAEAHRLLEDRGRMGRVLLVP